MNKIIGNNDLVDTDFVLSHFNLTVDGLQGLMTHGYVHPVIFETEYHDLTLLWSTKVFHDAYDYIDKLEREYEVVQSFRMQSE